MTLATATAELRQARGKAPATRGGARGWAEKGGGLGLRPAWAQPPPSAWRGGARRHRENWERRPPPLVHLQESLHLSQARVSWSLKQSRRSARAAACQLSGLGSAARFLGPLRACPSPVGGQPWVSRVALLLGVGRLSTGAVEASARVSPTWQAALRCP